MRDILKIALLIIAGWCSGIAIASPDIWHHHAAPGVTAS
jgi:hypothetical protein